MTLLKYKANGDENKPFTLFNDSKEYTYVAQSELLDAQGNNILKGVNFTAAQKEYSLNGDKVEVRLSAPETNGLKIDKVYTFTKDSYLVNVRFDITNTSGKPANLSADYRIVRDRSEPEGQGYFTRSFVGPVVYTPEGKFQKVSFSDLDDDAKSGKNEAEYARKTQTGWLGMIEHHFMSTWILQPKGGQSVCAAGDCRIDIKRRNDNLYSTSVSVPLAAIQNGAKSEASINLYAGPQTTSVIANIADNLQLAKDYGKVHWFASPPLLAPEPTAQHYRQLGLGNHRFDHYRQSRTLPADQRLLPLDGKNARRRAQTASHQRKIRRRPYGATASHDAALQRRKNQPAGRLPTHAVANPRLHRLVLGIVRLRRIASGSLAGLDYRP